MNRPRHGSPSPSPSPLSPPSPSSAALGDAIRALQLAETVMKQQSGLLARQWSQLAPILGRQSLEAALHHWWMRHEPSAAKASMRAQLLCLPYYIDAGRPGEDDLATLAHDVTYVWHRLSEAAHYRTYHLQPTEHQLGDWLSIVARFVAHVKTTTQ